MSEMDSDSASEMEDVTVTRTLPVNEDMAMDEDSPMELSVLAASSRITELSYSVSDIQTRLFEIQELRHLDDSMSSGDASLAIENALTSLMDSIISVGSSLEEVNKAMAPAIESVKGPMAQGDSEHGPILRKHAALLSEWQNVQSDVSRLRSELQEDQLLVRFRTAVDQAAGMMDSLDKAVEACQEYIWRRGKYLRLTGSDSASQKSAEALANFTEVVDHYERVKKYYMQSSTQAMASIDKTIHSRDIKNGEVLRRHTELSARWKSIRERIARTDREIEALKRPPDPDPSEAGSVRSRTTASSRPESQSTTLSTSESVSMTLSQSLSPFRKLASRMTSGFRTPNRKDKGKEKALSPMPPPAPRTTSPINRRVMSPASNRPAVHSIFSTPSHGMSSLSVSRGTSSAPPKPRWNISTKPVEDTQATVKPTSTRPSLQGHSRQPSASGRQSSMSGRYTPASRPMDPGGTTATPKNILRASASRPETPGGGPRKRPPTPSQIPAPVDVDIGPPSLQRTLATPILGPPSLQGTLFIQTESPENLNLLTPPKARRASQSRIPAPAFRPSRPTSPSASTSSYFPDGSTSPSALSTAFLSAVGSPTGSVGQYPFGTMGPTTPSRLTQRPRAPPSSFRGTTPMPTPSRTQSRPSSRASAGEPPSSLDNIAHSLAMDQLAYTPHPKDPLDVEIARVVNSMVHGYFAERVTPITVGHQQGPESSAQYGFTNPMGRKVLVCKLVVVEKSAPRGSLDTGMQQTRRVICRVGGGWESLSAFLARGV